MFWILGRVGGPGSPSYLPTIGCSPQAAESSLLGNSFQEDEEETAQLRSRPETVLQEFHVVHWFVVMETT